MTIAPERSIEELDFPTPEIAPQLTAEDIYAAVAENLHRKTRVYEQSYRDFFDGRCCCSPSRHMLLGCQR